MKTCPYCAEQIQDQAIKCRYCGEFLDGRAFSPDNRGPYPFTYWGYEYRSDTEIFGWPLIHIARGFNPNTGLPRIARGVIAVGDVAIGGIALGGLALGGLTFGGFSLGLLAIGGVAVGGIAAGGLALALFLAVGGLAASLSFAVGGLAIAPYSIGATGIDPEFLKLLDAWLPGLGEVER